MRLFTASIADVQHGREFPESWRVRSRCFVRPTWIGGDMEFPVALGRDVDERITTFLSRNSTQQDEGFAT